MKHGSHSVWPDARSGEERGEARRLDWREGVRGGAKEHTAAIGILHRDCSCKL